MFCDCDDCFANIYALDDIMSVLKAGIHDRFDMLWTHCWEEMQDGIVCMIPGYRIFVFCHGKIYNRAFLKREDVWFDETLTFNEDSCFNAVLIARTTNKRLGEIKSSSPVYTWIRRAGSVTTDPKRQDEGTYCNFRRNLIVTEENRLHRPDQYAAMVTRTAYDVYFMIQSSRITASCKQKILLEFAPWISDRMDVFADVSKEMLEGIRSISKDELTEPDEQIPDDFDSVSAWVREVAG